MSRQAIKPKGEKGANAILESEADLEKLCRDFDVTDEEDIEDIVSGRIGENIDW